MKRNKHAAAEITHTAAERSQDIVDDVVKKVLPLVAVASGALAPVAKDAKKKSAHFAATAVDKAQPAIDDALDGVREKVSHDIIPGLQKALYSAAELPMLDGLSKKQIKKLRKDAKKAAKKGDMTLSRLAERIEPDRGPSPVKVAAIIAGVAAVLGGIAVALRKYLANGDESGWAAHEPSTAYTAPVDDVVTEGEPVEDMVDEGAPVTTADVIADAHVAEDGNTVGLDDARVEGTIDADKRDGEPHPFQ